MTEKQLMTAAGMTEQEAKCWELTVQLYNAFDALPVLHPGDEPDVRQAIHVIQWRLLGRQTYRKYRELQQPAPAGG